MHVSLGEKNWVIFAVEFRVGQIPGPFGRVGSRPSRHGAAECGGSFAALLGRELQPPAAAWDSPRSR